VLAGVKTNKAAGPDGIPPWILKDFAEILAGINLQQLPS
jgi:hypothetical protein